jgi:hypothetical protein
MLMSGFGFLCADTSFVIFIFYIIVALEIHCDIYKSSHSISQLYLPFQF